jgi:hypothetical protein
VLTTRNRARLSRARSVTRSPRSGLVRAGPEAFGIRGFKVRAIAGIAGPVAFTGTWIVASLLQTGHSAAEVQISGLAAPDARDPWIMIAGFAALGGCAVAFGSALREALGGPGRAGPAPRLIEAAGALTVAAGLLRRDRMLLASPAGESWHNHAHDVASLLIYTALVAAPLLLARGLRGDPRWRAPGLLLSASGLATAAVLTVFVSGALGTWNGVLQRIGVSLPLAALCAVALRLLAADPPGHASARAGVRRHGPLSFLTCRNARRSSRSPGTRCRSATQTRSTSREPGTPSSTSSAIT